MHNILPIPWPTSPALALALALTSTVPLSAQDPAVQRPRPPSGLRLVGPLAQANPATSPPANPAGIPSHYKLIYQQDFTQAEALRDFATTDPNAWRIAPAADPNKPAALELSKQSKYSPPVRSPVNIALLADRVFSDFILEVDLKQTGREYGHRDMCLFFGVRDPAHFYYAHIATKADDNAHNVFIVNNAPRVKIAQTTTEGARWGLEEWHRVRLERNAATGLIKVYFDDLAKPIMVAEDTRFPSGYIGFGSFDDTGQATRIRIWAPSVEMQKTEFYSRPAQ